MNRRLLQFFLVCANLAYSGKAFHIGKVRGSVLRLSATELKRPQSSLTIQRPELFRGYGSSVRYGWRLKSALEQGQDPGGNFKTRIRNLILSIWRILTFPLRRFRVHQSKTLNGEQYSVEEEETMLEDSETSSGSVDEMPLENLKVTATVIEEQVSSSPADLLLGKKEESSPAAAFKVAPRPKSTAKPSGARWATASVDLSGDWVLIASEEFKEEYDEYLKRLGQPLIVRGIALGIIYLTSEYTKQTDEGRSLYIRGTNARGIWERTLIASGADATTSEYKPSLAQVVTADNEEVEAEAWWEDGGTVHCSWMRGLSKYGGGDFESKRYLENSGKVLVCESVFYPTDESRDPARVTWKFLRKGSTL